MKEVLPSGSLSEAEESPAFSSFLPFPEGVPDFQASDPSLSHTFRGARRALQDAVLGTALFLLLGAILGAYQIETRQSLRRTFEKLCKVMCCWGATLLFSAYFAHQEPLISRLYIGFCVVLCVTMLFWWRIAVMNLFRIGLVARVLRQRIVVVGWNEEAAQLARALEKDPLHPVEIVGAFPSAHNRYRIAPPEWVPRLGDYNHLAEWLGAARVDYVLVADLDPKTREMIALAELASATSSRSRSSRRSSRSSRRASGSRR
jgi:FlaA1/EpsC-like NDP-sugar epimerase